MSEQTVGKELSYDDFIPKRDHLNKHDRLYLEIKHYDDFGYTSIVKLQRGWNKTQAMLNKGVEDEGENSQDMSEEEITKLDERIDSHFLEVIIYDEEDRDELLGESEGFKRGIIEHFFAGVAEVMEANNPGSTQTEVVDGEVVDVKETKNPNHGKKATPVHELTRMSE